MRTRWHPIDWNKSVKRHFYRVYHNYPVLFLIFRLDFTLNQHIRVVER